LENIKLTKEGLHMKILILLAGVLMITQFSQPASASYDYYRIEKYLKSDGASYEARDEAYCKSRGGAFRVDWNQEGGHYQNYCFLADSHTYLTDDQYKETCRSREVMVHLYEITTCYKL
jgi:hypothetical protein